MGPIKPGSTDDPGGGRGKGLHQRPVPLLYDKYFYRYTTAMYRTLARLGTIV